MLSTVVPVSSEQIPCLPTLVSRRTAATDVCTRDTNAIHNRGYQSTGLLVKVNRVPQLSLITLAPPRTAVEQATRQQTTTTFTTHPGHIPKMKQNQQNDRLPTTNIHMKHHHTSSCTYTPTSEQQHTHTHHHHRAYKRDRSITRSLQPV